MIIAQLVEYKILATRQTCLSINNPLPGGKKWRIYEVEFHFVEFKVLDF
jgi:hypothetical protein